MNKSRNHEIPAHSIIIDRRAGPGFLQNSLQPAAGRLRHLKPIVDRTAGLTVRQAAAHFEITSAKTKQNTMTSHLLPAALLLTLSAGLAAAEVTEPEVAKPRKPVSAVPS